VAAIAVAPAILWLGTFGCSAARTNSDRAETCATCHGNAGDQSGAPSSGAHAAHVRAGTTWKAVDCDACHVKPVDVNSPGHLDGQVTITWGALATLGGLAPRYDPGTHACSGTYCHGGFPGGNASWSPVWTEVGMGQASCGTCHGDPSATPSALPANHPLLATGSTNATCNACHAGTVEPDGTIDAGGGKHVDGAVDFDPAAIHPAGWLDTGSPSFHGGAAHSSIGPCLGCHAVDPPARVTTVVCNDCHAAMGDPIAVPVAPWP
jgi:predicted CxxxxCH...CXXCH cytochrome family protein